MFYYAFQVSFFWFVLLSLAGSLFLNGAGTVFKTSEVRSHLHLNAGLSVYFSFSQSHGRKFTAVSESRQKSRILPCCVRAPAGVCSPFTCGALTLRDMLTHTMGAFAGSESRIRI